jgi:ABC-type uncharacterized transport system permease subunit
MSDRAMVFLFSVFMIAASAAAAFWLLITGQADTVDGLFMVLTSLLVAACFALYVLYMIRRAMEAQGKPAAKTAPASKSAAKPAAEAVTQ